MEKSSKKRGRGKHNKWNDKTLSELQYMIDTHMCYKDIARHYSIKVETLYKVINANGLIGIGTGNVPKPRPRRVIQC